MISVKHILLSSIAVLSSTACVSGLIPEPSPAEVVYRLTGHYTPVVPDENALILRIDRPTAPQNYQTDDVIVSPDGIRQERASGAVWAEPIPALVQHSLFNYLETRPTLSPVLPASGARSQKRVHLTIQSFNAVFDRGEELPPLAKVQYRVTVADAATRNLIGTYNAAGEIRADAVRVSSIVTALSLANEDAIIDIADWLEGLDAHPS